MSWKNGITTFILGLLGIAIVGLIQSPPFVETITAHDSIIVPLNSNETVEVSTSGNLNDVHYVLSSFFPEGEYPIKDSDTFEVRMGDLFLIGERGTLSWEIPGTLFRQEGNLMAPTISHLKGANVRIIFTQAGEELTVVRNRDDEKAKRIVSAALLAMMAIIAWAGYFIDWREGGRL